MFENILNCLEMLHGEFRDTRTFIFYGCLHITVLVTLVRSIVRIRTN